MTAVPDQTERTSVTRHVLRVALGLWGVLHIVGGFATVVADPADGFASVATAADPSELPSAPGAVEAATLDFLMFLIGAAGLVVTILVVTRMRRDWPNGVEAALWVIGVSDLGLVLFYLLPGHMSWADGAWGPILFALALGSLLMERRRAMPRSGLAA